MSPATDLKRQGDAKIRAGRLRDCRVNVRPSPDIRMIRHRLPAKPSKTHDLNPRSLNRAPVSEGNLKSVTITSRFPFSKIILLASLPLAEQFHAFLSSKLFEKTPKLICRHHH